MLSKEEVLKIANLANLELTDEEVEMFQPQLKDIISYVDKLQELNIEKVEPTSHPIDIQNRFQEQDIEYSENLDIEHYFDKLKDKIRRQIKTKKIL